MKKYELQLQVRERERDTQNGCISNITRGELAGQESWVLILEGNQNGGPWGSLCCSSSSWMKGVSTEAAACTLPLAAVGSHGGQGVGDIKPASPAKAAKSHKYSSDCIYHSRDYYWWTGTPFCITVIFTITQICWNYYIHSFIALWSCFQHLKISPLSNALPKMYLANLGIRRDNSNLIKISH